MGISPRSPLKGTYVPHQGFDTYLTIVLYRDRRTVSSVRAVIDGAAVHRTRKPQSSYPPLPPPQVADFLCACSDNYESMPFVLYTLDEAPNLRGDIDLKDPKLLDDAREWLGGLRSADGLPLRSGLPSEGLSSLLHWTRCVTLTGDRCLFP